MIYPIVAYPDSVLRRPTQEVEENDPQVLTLINDMFATMYKANGVGLAAPQIGKSLRVFVVDASALAEEGPNLKNFKKTFINPIKLEEDGKSWNYNEGCLSVPTIREDISRRQNVTIEYFDEKWQLKTETFSGIAARIILHEYDHIEGKLFIDYLQPLKKKMLKTALERIGKGEVSVNYKMKFPKK